jgi:amphi-Trp domain-containing protein
MSDVKLERKESLSRDEAARWLSMLAKAFGSGNHAELPFGPSMVSVHIPDHVRAELEVEVDGDQVEIEVEFKWSTVGHDDQAPALATAAAPPRARHPNGARKPARTTRSAKR